MESEHRGLTQRHTQAQQQGMDPLCHLPAEHVERATSVLSLGFLICKSMVRTEPTLPRFLCTFSTVTKHLLQAGPDDTALNKTHETSPL